MKTKLKPCLWLLLSSMLFGGSCQNRQGLEVTELSPTEVEVALKVNQNFLILPIQDNSSEKKVILSAGSEYRNEFQIRLAQDSIDYYMPVDLRRWPKSTLVKLLVPEKNAKAIWRDSIYMANQFNYAYADKFRPFYHFTPAYGWMNDPNGMVYLDGEYHLFYQYNPFGAIWGNMHWGHAVSKDLFHWQYLPIALEPDSLGTIYSGCAVIDSLNTAGFGKNAMILFYTSAGVEQAQSMAYSTDKGKTFTKYDKNPVLFNPGKKDFRDPKVFWYEPGKHWVMVVSAANEMEFYSSLNLKQWQYESSFGAQEGAHGGVWECPDLFELAVDKDSTQMKWILLCNMNPGGIQGGSATQYFVGSFDGKVFKNDDKPDKVKWMDWGKDHYAAVTWANTVPGRRIAIAWMNNWEYGQQVPTVVYRSAKTAPRELTLSVYADELTLYSYPVRELLSVSGDPNDINSFDVKDEANTTPLLPDNKGAYDVNFLLLPGTSKKIAMRLANSLNEYVVYQFNLNEGMLYFNRQASGITDFNPNFEAIERIPIPVKDIYEVRMLVDKCSIELFLDGGAINVTNLVFPNQPYDILSFAAQGEGTRVAELSVTPISQTMFGVMPFKDTPPTK